MTPINARPAALSRGALHSVSQALLSIIFVLFTAPGYTQTLDSSGKEFILGFNPNTIPEANLELHITSHTDTFVTVEYPVTSPSISTTVFVAENGNTVVRLPSTAHSGGFNLARAFAENDFVVYMVNRAPVSSDAALAIPVDALGTEYIVTTYTDGNSPPQFTVFAVTDDTTVTINPTGTVRDMAGTPHPAGVPLVVNLDRGEGAYFYSERGLEDLTGTTVSGDLPIGVVNGSGCTFVPPTSFACDHLFEVAQPVASWGKEVLVTDFPYREPGSIYRVLAAEDGTAVLLDGAPLATLDRAAYFETTVLPGSHVFSADKPIFVVQFMTSTTYPGNDEIGDPAMLNAVPAAQYQSGYTFSTVGGGQFAEHFLTVFARTADVGAVLLDGAPVDSAAFAAIPGTAFSVAVVPLAEGAHTTSSPSPHGISVEGYNVFDSYVYPGGGSFAPLSDFGDANPPICTVASLSGPPDYVVGAAEDRRPSEDSNGNGTLDPGEDANGNGLIDEDSGIASVAIIDDSNLTLTVDPFTPGAERADFRIDLIDPQQPGSGVVQALDVAGNSCEQAIEIEASTSETCLEGLAARSKPGKVQLIWRLADASDSYQIRRGASLDGAFTVVGSQAAGMYTYLDSTVANGSLYYYQVGRVADTGEAICTSEPVAAYVPATRMRLTIVPDLKGQDQGSADSALTSAGLSVGTTSTLPSTSVPAGQVLSQDPPASSVVPRGFAVSYAISSGAALVTVPDLVGLTEADALAALDAAALLAGSRTTDNSDTVPEGEVISQLPAAGMAVNAGSAISFVVSAGPANKPPVLAAIGAKVVDERELLEFTVSATDPDGDELLFAIGNPPSNAQLTNRGDGTAGFRWTPDDDQTGVFPVSIIVTDNGTPRLIDFEVFTITSININRPPTLYASDIVAFEGLAKRFFITASDLDGDNLVLEATGLPDGAEFIDLGSGTGQFLWTPDVSQIGEHFVEFTATDDGEPPLSESVEITITVNDINHPPAFDPLGNIIATDVVEFTISATDPDGDALSFTQTGLPTGADFVDNGDGTADVSWTPSATGDYWITFTVTDDGSPPQSVALAIKITVTLDITVPNVTGVPLATAVQAIETAGLAVGSVTTEFHPTTPPGWTTDQQPAAGTTANAGTSVDLMVSLGPAEVTVPNVVGFTQADAETTIAAALLVLGTVTEQPSDAVPAGNVISQAPVGGTTVANGSAVDIVVSTGIPNRPPSIVSTPPTLAEVGQLYSYNVEAIDPDGDILTYSLDEGPSGMGINAGSGRIEWTPAGDQQGDHSVVVRVQDPAGLADTQSFAVAVAAASGFPVAAIETPLEDAELTGLVDIVGEASDDNLHEYILAYAPVSSDDFTEFAKGTTPVTGGTLGSLDTTLLENGLVSLRLTVTDLGGKVATATRTVQLVGRNKPGHFSISYTDLAVPVAGIPIEIKRTYDSRRRGTGGDFGYGWDLEVIKSGTYANNRAPGDGWEMDFGGGVLASPCDIDTETKSHITEIRFSDTEFYRFALRIHTLGIGSFISGGCLMTAGYEQIGGVPGATLSLIGNNQVFWELGSEELTFPPLHPRYPDTFEPERVALTTLSGRRFDLHIEDGLEAIGDTNGNTVVISPDGVIHSSGKSISFLRDAEGRITRVTDPDGKVIAYAYDSAGDLGAVTDRLGYTTQFEYEPGHFLTTIRDPLGNVPLRNEYDENGRLVAQVDADGNRTEIDTDLAANTTTVTDRLGNVTQLAYNDAGFVTSATVAGQTKQFTFDDRGNKLTETDPLGNVRQFTYDGNDNLASETDALGNTTVYSYDANGRLTTLLDSTGHATSLGYDGNGNLETSTNAAGEVIQSFTYNASGNPTQASTLGGTTEYTYDAFGNVLTEQGPGSRLRTYTYDLNGNRLTETVRRTTDSGAADETTTFAYDANGQLISVTDPLGNTTTFSYDALGKVASQTDPLGRVSRFEYDSRGNLAQKEYPDGGIERFVYDQENRRTGQTDRSGRTTFFAYDAEGRLIETIYPDGARITNNYDAAGNLVSTVDELGNTTTFTYDATGKRIRTTDALGNATTMTYDAVGAMTAVTDPLGRNTVFEYDQSNFGAPRPIIKRFADGSETRQDYAASGRLSEQTDELGNRTTYDYDEAGNLISVTDALGNVTTHTYDELGNVLSTTDANGNTTTFAYDGNARLIRRTLPLGMEESFVYDAAGNMIQHTDFNGDSISFQYDLLDQLVRKTLPDGSNVDYAYGANGEVISVTDARGVTRYTYDLRDRVVQVINPDGTTIEYTYDATGNRTTVSTITGTTTYAYDPLNRITSVTDPQGGISRYTYDAAGNQVELDLPNGTSASYGYDARNRLVSIEHTRSSGPTVLGRYDYLVDAAGRRVRLVESGGRVVDYSYDAIGRLTTELDNLTGSPVMTTYSYDAVGNRLIVNWDGAPTAFTYDANNRMLTAGTASFGYDDNGNLVRAQFGLDVTTYDFDAQGRLIRQTAPDGSVVAYDYDDAGNRVTRDAAGNVTSFLVDTVDSGGLPQVLAERDGAGNLTSAYVYGNDLLRLHQSAASHYYHTDAVGSTRLLTDAAGAVSDAYSYDAFGELVDISGSTPNFYLFAGEALDAELGLYNLRARNYSPEAGRFISMDPFDGSIMDPRSMHGYTYAHNDPVNNLDPTGQFTLSGVATSLGARSILSRVVRGYLANKENIDRAKAIAEFIIEAAGPGIGTKRLNQEATKEKLLQPLKIGAKATANVALSPDAVGINVGLKIAKVQDADLGNGAVAKSFAIATALTGDNTAMALVNQQYGRLAAAWMAVLPTVELENDGKTNVIPAGYYSCHFNAYVRINYNLELMNKLVDKLGNSAAQESLQVLGGWLGYGNLIQLMSRTALDAGTSIVPPVPPGEKCF